ncbi:MAG: hypothetical protein K8R91_00585 [Phycisphaerae bacterium]|nr:hypothetical protein [Phycisphaerae bacterium]
MRKLTLLSVVAMLVLASLSCIITRKKPACEADNLLLTASSFPDDLWEEFGSRDKRGAPSVLGIERAGTTFETQRHGGAIQEYFRFSSEEGAKDNYESFQYYWTNLAPEGSIITVPEDLRDLKLGADEFRVGCSQGVIETCNIIVLYRTYIVGFNIDMPSVAYADFIQLLEEIDQKMLACIED